MIEVKIRDEFIKLGQALKLAGLVDSGVEAKIVVQEGEVKYNGAICTERGKKMYEGDTAEYNGESLIIVR